MPRYFAIRVGLVLLAGVLAGAAAWLVVRDQPPEYERTLTFVLRPSANLTDAQIPDAVRGLSQQDAQLVNTIGGAIGTQRFLERALLQAGVERGERFSARSTVRPGSDIVEIHLLGPDPEPLVTVGDRYSALARFWVGDVYRAYTLDFLEVDASEGPVAPRVGQMIGLATMLGLLLGAGVVFAEWKARGRHVLLSGGALSTRRADRALLVEGSSHRLDRLEAVLREHLDTGEELVREGPRRFRIFMRARETERVPTRQGQRPI